MPKIKENVTLKNAPKKITEYPNTNIILYTNGRRSYHYTVKKKGLYSQPSVLTYTQGKNKYKIPDYYCVETTWGRENNKKTVKCSINYIEDKPLFKIMYGTNFSEVVQSNISSTTVANEVLKKLFPRNEKSLISGIHLFGIHLRTLEHSREGKRENHPQLKSLELCDRSTIYRRQNKFENQIKERVQIEGAKIYGEDQAKK
ncbi:hypothetical protein C1646_766157 [Rhizophagus diaphanus]|nr:hypothetical protein C1646_766157 [Rhizophagus diaphanus] [Rhizophagus sp. MUCL 43196]